MSNEKIFYWVEMSTDSASAVSSACETFANVCAGKLDIVEEIVKEAYRKRTGKEMNDVEIDQIQKALKLIQYMGWDSTYGNDIKIHGYSGMTDSLFDVAEVLNYQLGEDGSEPHKDSRYPMHWNDKMPLCRIVRRKTSVYNRYKQLAIFPNK